MAYLTFSAARAASLDLNGNRGELARRANGVHAAEADALAFARREGPAVVLTPDGRRLEVARERDAAADARIAAEESALSRRRALELAPRRTAPLHRPI